MRKIPILLDVDTGVYDAMTIMVDVYKRQLKEGSLAPKKMIWRISYKG